MIKVFYILRALLAHPLKIRPALKSAFLAPKNPKCWLDRFRRKYNSNFHSSYAKRIINC